ncbi:hypothetical protein CWE13_02930 [Aliidiomarina shirensis]|uniref:Uncharacterized protein n=1 Tax=Aliidiomarina shirensis TaxID=1048642 RepID=A0A432WXX6_9GAMM|nr:hypothetical protein [Aliidiomarina shirensis]RUO38615.1 hypothetical protein CWE13_02930 [Aliidiomarina shirensis]
MKRITALSFFIFLAGCTTQHNIEREAEAAEQCISEAERLTLLNLDEEAFDQDPPSGGWRGIAEKSGCEIAAADLIRDYRERHNSTNTIIYWHEGQMRAMANDYAEAIALFEKSKKTKEKDLAGWNEYVDASIAFLRKDQQALIEAREALAAVAVPPGLDVKDGLLVITDNSGKPFKMRWPLNIDVVDGFIRCFEKDYRDAYGDSACRQTPPN